MIDKLREHLLPALALMILASLWVLAKSRICEQDVARSVPPTPMTTYLRAVAAEQDQAAESTATATPTSTATATTDAVPDRP